MTRLRITLVRGTTRHELSRTAADPAEAMRIAREAAGCLAHVAARPWRVQIQPDDGTTTTPPCHLCGDAEAQPEPWEIRTCTDCGQPTCWMCRSLDHDDCDACHQAWAEHTRRRNRESA